MRPRSTPRSPVRSIACSTLACGLCLMASVTHAQTGGTGNTGTGNTGTGTTTIGGGGGGGAAGGQGQAQFAGPELLTVGESIDATGGTGFAGRGSAADNFVGAGIQVGQGQAGGFQAGGGRGGQNQFQQLDRGQVGGGRGLQQATGPSRSELVRPRFRIAFAYTPAQSTTLSNKLRTRMTSLSSRVPAMSGVEVSLDERGNATLTGSVDTDRQRETRRSDCPAPAGRAARRQPVTGERVPTDLARASMTKCRLLLLVSLTLLVAQADAPARLPMSRQPNAERLFARENLVAWCIVPFDAKSVAVRPSGRRWSSSSD